MAFSSDILPILKEFYGETQVHNTLFRGSPTLAAIEKKRAGGKHYVVPLISSRGGAIIGNYSLVAALSATRASHAAFQVPYGNSFAWFDVSPKEWNASDMDAGAFIQIVRDLFFASGEGLRQTNGAAVFGSGLGDVGIVRSIDTSARLYFYVNQWAAMALDVGSLIVFAAGPQPTGALRSATQVEVSSIVEEGEDSVKVTVSSAFNAAVAVGDWVCLYGFRSSTATPVNFYGFRQWLPHLGDRTGATWAAYIATAFCGVDRSTNVVRLAGNFVLRDDAAGELYTDAILRGVRATRRNGARPDMIVLNDFDWGTVAQEIDAQKQYFQKINGADASAKVELNRGLSAMMFAQSSTWIQYVVDDPYCPRGLAYILEKESWVMAMLSNPKVIQENLPSTNEGGAPEAAKAAAPPEAYAFNIEDYVAVSPASTADGMGSRVTIQCFGAFACRNPAHNCVVKLDVTMV